MAKWTAADLPDQTGRTWIITGSNSGLGLASAKAVAAKGGRVVLAVRNAEKGDAAQAQVGGASEVRSLDLASLESIRAFADAWGDQPIDVLLNNAGVMALPESRTADGFEMQVGTNHLGHFALTNLLLPHVTSRVTTVASVAHKPGKVSLKDLNWETRKYDRWGAYCQSKLANLLFTLTLSERLAEAGSDVQATAAHPGYSATNLQSHTSSLINGLVMKVGNVVLAQSDEMGCLPSLYAATQDVPPAAYVGPGGFQEMRGHPALAGRTGRALDAERGRGLWDLSESLTGVTFPLAGAAA